MSSEGSVLQKGDIVVFEKSKIKTIGKIEIGKIYGFETKDEFILRRIDSKSKTQISLKPDNTNFYQEELDWSEITTTWQIRSLITNNFSAHPTLNSRLQELETKIKKINLA